MMEWLVELVPLLFRSISNHCWRNQGCNVSIFIQFMLLRRYDNAPGRQCVQLLVKSRRGGESGLSWGWRGCGRNVVFERCKPTKRL